jgi:hypothetical protein
MCGWEMYLTQRNFDPKVKGWHVEQSLGHFPKYPNPTVVAEVVVHPNEVDSDDVRRMHFSAQLTVVFAASAIGKELVENRNREARVRRLEEDNEISFRVMLLFANELDPRNH